MSKAAEILAPEPEPLTPENWLDGLSDQQRAFVLEYLVDLNVQRAAKAAGYSDHVSRTVAYMWITHPGHRPEVFRAIQFALEARRRDLMVTGDMIIREAAALAFSDMRRAARWRSHRIEEQDEIDAEDGTIVVRTTVSNTVELVASDDLDDATAKAIKEIRQDKDGNVSIKFHEKGQALYALMRHLGLVDELKDAGRRMGLGQQGQIAGPGDAVNATAKQAGEAFRDLIEGD